MASVEAEPKVSDISGGFKQGVGIDSGWTEGIGRVGRVWTQGVSISGGWTKFRNFEKFGPGFN